MAELNRAYDTLDFGKETVGDSRVQRNDNNGVKPQIGACARRTVFVLLIALGILLLVAVLVLQLVILNRLKGSCEETGTETTTTAMTIPSSVSSVPSLSSAHSVTSTPTPVSTTTENSTCPEGWERNGSSCYYIDERRLSFDNAQEFCTKRSAILVHVNDAAENDFLKSLMEKSGSIHFWIGLKYNVSEWRWIDDGTVAGFTYWGPGEPEYGGALGCCSAWSGYSYRWHDSYCSHGTASPLCEKVLS